jgi:hypothetical protein
MTTTGRTDLVALLARYAPAIHRLATDDHHVASPLGAWLVLALAGPAAPGSGEERADLERALGCDLDEAVRIAARLLGHPHPLVRAAAALWWRDDPPATPLAGYAERLPPAVTREPLAGQAQVDAWAREHTLGLIDRFPLTMDPQVLLVLASAIATRVSWDDPFDVVPAAELHGPFSGMVERALRSVERHRVYLARTAAAGLVGVHVASSAGGLAVVSVLAGTRVAREAALSAAYEVARSLDERGDGLRVSLFDVEAGTSELGEVIEDVVTAAGTGPVEEGWAVLPGWRARTELDLLADPSTGFAAAGEILRRLVEGASLEARQVAVAAYDRVGFEAAAITAIAVLTSFVEPRERPRRTLTLRFGRPYAAVAVARSPTDAPPGEQASVWHGLPVFGAWVAEPEETEPV